jgi:hypothetical protein
MMAGFVGELYRAGDPRYRPVETSVKRARERRRHRTRDHLRRAKLSVPAGPVLPHPPSPRRETEG